MDSLVCIDCGDVPEQESTWEYGRQGQVEWTRRPGGRCWPCHQDREERLEREAEEQLEAARTANAVLYLDGLILPGGAARSGELPHEAAAHHLLAQTGLSRRLTHVLAVDYTPPDRYLERINLVFDGGIADGRPAGARFVPVRELGRAMAPAQAARVADALAGRALPFLLHGQRAA
ncbi:hypothetical protein CP971_34055 [Streptomyces viridifaciens]|nr:hypothetical protein CP971_34055 [Streptomyces viridifaciens]